MINITWMQPGIIIDFIDVNHSCWLKGKLMKKTCCRLSMFHHDDSMIIFMIIINRRIYRECTSILGHCSLNSVASRWCLVKSLSISSPSPLWAYCFSSRSYHSSISPRTILPMSPNQTLPITLNGSISLRWVLWLRTEWWEPSSFIFVSSIIAKHFWSVLWFSMRYLVFLRHCFIFEEQSYHKESTPYFQSDISIEYFQPSFGAFPS